MVYKCLDDAVYEAFIKEAVKRSDLIEIYVNWPRQFNGFSNELKKELSDSGFTDEYINITESVWDKRVKGDIQLFFSLTVPFLKRLEPFFIDGQTIEHRSKCYYLRSELDIIPILLEPKRISAWGYPLLPDDLSFITDNKYWFFSESHENSCTLYADDENDYEFWRNMGIAFKSEFDYEYHVVNRCQLGDI
ncbi:MAG: hypothetical protein J6Q89_03750 [Clostridia bacterium]|nr:hypothetical protein [Clostridia bacterium]